MALKVNVWIEIRDTFAYPAELPEDDNALQAKNRETLSRASDITVVPLLFKQRSQGPRTYTLYSLLYDVETDQELEQAVELFQSENPGDTNVMGAWYWEYGNQFMTTPTFTETEVGQTGVPLYPIPGSLSNFMPDEGDPPVPNATLRDINLYAGQAPRLF